MNFDNVADRRGSTSVHPQGQLLGEQAYFLAQRDVARIEEPSRQHEHVAHRFVEFVGSDHLDVLVFAVKAHAVVRVHDGGGGHDAACQLLAHRRESVLVGVGNRDHRHSGYTRIGLLV